MPTLPNMGLILPTEGGDADIWDTLLAAVFELIDEHDHTSGKGTPVKVAGLRIDGDVAWNYGGDYFAITGAKAFDFEPVLASEVTGYAAALWVSSVDNELYWRTTGGSNVKLTDGTELNVSAFTGGISGDYAAVGADFRFDDATDSYWARQQEVAGVRAWASLRVGNVDIYEAAASITNRIRIQSPSALAASYTLTLPAALPGSTSVMQLSAAGVMSASNTLPSVTAPTVTASTDYAHTAEFTASVPLINTAANTSIGVTTGDPRTVDSTGAPFWFYTPPLSILGLRKGDRVKNVRVRYSGNAGLTVVNVGVEHYRFDTGAASTTGSASTAQGGINVVPGSGKNTLETHDSMVDQMWIVISGSASGITIEGIDVTWDHP